jgi:hypothetical protein
MNKVFMTIIVVLLFVVALGWTGVTLYESYMVEDTNSGLSSVLSTPLPDSLNTTILEDVNERIENLTTSPQDFIEVENETKEQIDQLSGDEENTLQEETGDASGS